MESPKISWPVLIKFYVYHQWDGGKADFRFWSRFHPKTVVAMATENLFWRKLCLHAYAFSFDPIFVKLTDTEDMHKISDEFEFRSVQTTFFGVRCPRASNFP